MNVSKEKFGDLNCQLVDHLPENTVARYLVILCHGFGAPGDDLVSIGAEVLQRSNVLSSQVRFAFPEAPLSLESLGMWGARAWWHLDIEKLNRALMNGEMRDLRKDLPEGLAEAREMFMKFLREILEHQNVSLDSLFLGGFSQGSMLTCDVSLHLPQNIGGLILWSSTLLDEDKWRGLALGKKGLPVLQSHGRQDPMLPYSIAEELKMLLTEANCDVEFLPFDGPHTISLEVLERFATWLEEKIN